VSRDGTDCPCVDARHSVNLREDALRVRASILSSLCVEYQSSQQSRAEFSEENATGLFDVQGANSIKRTPTSVGSRGSSGLSTCFAGYILKDVQDKVVPFVVRLFAGIKVVPICVVHRDAAVGRIAVVHMVVGDIAPREIVRIVHVGVVVKTSPVGRLSSTGRLCFPWY